MAGQFQINSSSQTNYTLVSNHFIDRYMPQANGSYVKVYLYLLRLLSDKHTEHSLTCVADSLDETEKDVERALKYWEKQKLLHIERSADAVITGIDFLELPDRQSSDKTENAPEAVRDSSGEANSSEAGETTNTANLFEGKNTPAKTETMPVKATQEPAAVPVRWTSPERPSYSAGQIKALTSLDEIKALNIRLEQITGGLLKASDIQLVLYLYESVGFSTELIAYLYEYCVSKNKKNTAYIESVAIAWAENGINTVEKAKAESAVYSNCYNVVNRAFGLNRAPGSVELQFLHRWSNSFGFDSSIIEEACNRTMLAVTRPDFKYTDKILTSWHDAGVKSKKDIAVLDSEFARQNNAKAAPVPGRSTQTQHTPAASGNRFNTFPQRKYSSSDYSAMEKRLLNKS